MDKRLKDVDKGKACFYLLHLLYLFVFYPYSNFILAPALFYPI